MALADRSAGVPRLAKAMASGTPADRAASAIYHLVPEQHLDVLEQFARMPAGDRRTLLTQLDPRLGPYQVFLDELAAQLVVIFDKEAEDDAPDNPGAAESA